MIRWLLLAQSIIRLLQARAHRFEPSCESSGIMDSIDSSNSGVDGVRKQQHVVFELDLDFTSRGGPLVCSGSQPDPLTVY